MNITTRNYYIPKNMIGRHVMNTIVDRIECSIGNFKINRNTDAIRFTVTCNLKDIPYIEKILRRYDMM